MQTVAIALGSNLPLDGLASLQVVRRAALALAEDQGGPLRGPRLSRLYVTEPVNVLAVPTPRPGDHTPDVGGPYINAVVTGLCGLQPANILARLHDIERAFGRDKSTQPHGAARTLDLDLLLVGDCVVEESERDPGADWGLRLPHPGLRVLPRPASVGGPGARLFVLAPLADLLPDALVPVIGRRVRELAALARAVTPPECVRTI